MERLEGVKQVRTSFEKRETYIEYDPKLATVEKLVATIERLGYKARVAAEGNGTK